MQLTVALQTQIATAHEPPRDAQRPCSNLLRRGGSVGAVGLQLFHASIAVGATGSCNGGTLGEWIVYLIESRYSLCWVLLSALCCSQKDLKLVGR